MGTKKKVNTVKKGAKIATPSAPLGQTKSPTPTPTNILPKISESKFTLLYQEALFTYYRERLQSEIRQEYSDRRLPQLRELVLERCGDILARQGFKDL